MKAHYGDIGIINIIRQRLKDIELQRWLSEINKDTRKDANQGNKMRTYRLFKTTDNYKCEDYQKIGLLNPPPPLPWGGYGTTQCPCTTLPHERGSKAAHWESL